MRYSFCGTGARERGGRAVQGMRYRAPTANPLMISGVPDSHVLAVLRHPSLTWGVREVFTRQRTTTLPRRLEGG